MRLREHACTMTASDPSLPHLMAMPLWCRLAGASVVSKKVAKINEVMGVQLV